jgi:YD repeat-containing protein
VRELIASLVKTLCRWYSTVRGLMKSCAPDRYRFQIKRDRDGRHRWYVYNGYGTMVGRHPDGFPTELEARLDAEHVRRQVANAPIAGEVDEWARGA